MGSPTPDGLLLVDKPAGMTSHDVVAVVRRALGERRVGHAGTLDPFATGLLVLLAGRGTRLIPYLDAEPKVYEATIRFGAETDTDDSTGVAIRHAPIPARADIEAAISRLTGELDQVPPAYSAKKVGGTRAYDAARRGKPLDLAPVRVTVFEWLVRAHRAGEVDVMVRCSGGTYVRALARDLGVGAGSAAHLSALRRVWSGRFAVSEATRLDAVDRGDAPLRPLRDAVAHLPEQPLDAAQVGVVAHGNAVRALFDAPFAALTSEGSLVAVAARRDAEWWPRVVLRDP
jgi:tRNA pseudouridine55 synthase